MSDKNLNDLATENEWIHKLLTDGNLSQRETAKEINSRLGGEFTTRSSVKRWRSKYSDLVEAAGSGPSPHSKKEANWGTAASSTFEANSGEAIADSNGGSITFTSDKPIESTQDWAHVFEIFKLSPDEYYIVEDTVRCKTWQQSKALEDGTRDVVQLYSYGARFAKKVNSHVTTEDLDVIYDRMFKMRQEPVLAPGTSEPCTFVVCWADLQLGKGEGGGVQATTDRFLKALSATEERILKLKREGRNITKIVVANMGDPIEGCDQNYAQQTFTVELNLRDQLLLALNLFSLGLSRLSVLAQEIEFLSVLCNHGEWNRLKGKSFTDDADNASGFIADALRMIFNRRDDADRFVWSIPRDEMIMPSMISGVQVAFTHGHKMPQSSDNIKGENQWLQNQTIKILRETGSEPRLWVTAHRHHAMVLDFGPWFRIQCSALDGGSKWYEDSTGKWSTPGITTFVVGTHDRRGFSDYEVL